MALTKAVVIFDQENSDEYTVTESVIEKDGKDIQTLLLKSENQSLEFELSDLKELVQMFPTKELNKVPKKKK
jgi:hypothetical protein